MGGVALPDEETSMLSAQEALVYTMVAAAESDREIDDAEIGIVADLVNHLPIFRGMDRAAATRMAGACSKLLASPGGRDRVFALIRDALSPELRETAYAIACDVIAVDGRLHRQELETLERVRADLEVEPAMARAIEQVTKVRFQAA
jgi:uncharacterized membrane protein YebE (DUF533 family)